MDEDELKRLEALCEAATPGPWTSEEIAVGEFEVYHGDGGPEDQVVSQLVLGENDTGFIVAAREALPRLTAEVRRLRAELEEERARRDESAIAAALKHDKLRRERDEARAKLGRARKAGRKLLSEVERNTCIHEETERLGVIWTRCTMCGRKWADDQGGFQPYEEPSWLEKARELLSKGDDDGK